jgi:hypothetical protein
VEAALIPRTVVIASRLSPDLLDLLSGDRPIRVVLLACDPVVQSRAVLAVALRGHAFAAQVSPSDPGHLTRVFQQMAEVTGPALVAIHTPVGSMDAILPEAARAVTSGEWPLYTGTPGEDGAMFELGPGCDLSEAMRGAARGAMALDRSLRSLPLEPAVNVAPVEPAPEAPEPLDVLADRLLILSGFGPDSDGSEEGLRAFTKNPAEAE